LLGQWWRPLGETKRARPAWLASFLVVAAWGCFLIQGVRDPLGGINSLWPIFGIANQLLASIALCLGTTVILKMQLAANRKNGRPILAWITLGPLLWLLAVTGTASVEKIFHPDPKIGFLSAARALALKLPELKHAMDTALAQSPVLAAAAAKAWQTTATLCFNARLDAAVTAGLLAMIVLIVMLSAREWVLLLARRKLSCLSETAPVWLPVYAVAEAKPFGIWSLFTLVLLLAKELSGEAAMSRSAERNASGDARACSAGHSEVRQRKAQAYVEVTQRRFDGINRCC
jgi:carbon starvation protein